MRNRKEHSLRIWLHQGFYRVLLRRSQQLTAESLRKPAIVFSPHQDDETLGCGGTIINKVAAGAAVQVVFMTDGHQSHSQLMDPKALAQIRRKEALAACKVLGVPVAMVTFLDFPDGRLGSFPDQAVEQLKAILNQSSATELYLPYRGEPTADHQAAQAVIQKTLTGQSRSYTLYEYPVWFWHHWPWVTLPQSNRQASWFVLKNTISAAFGLRLLRDFRCAVPVAAVREQKTAALNEHKSQMTQLFDDPNWLTLHDVSNGEFISNLFQDYELFHQYEYKPVKETW